MLAALGVYQEGVAKNVVNGKPVVSCVILFAFNEALVPTERPGFRPPTCTSTRHNVSLILVESLQLWSHHGSWRTSLYQLKVSGSPRKKMGASTDDPLREGKADIQHLRARAHPLSCPKGK